MKKQVTWLWHGGSSYGAPLPEDAETYPSIAAAMEEFSSRPADPYFPCVDEDTVDDGGPVAHCWFGPEVGDYPDFIIAYGPRGGCRRYRC